MRLRLSGTRRPHPPILDGRGEFLMDQDKYDAILAGQKAKKAAPKNKAKKAAPKNKGKK